MLRWCSPLELFSAWNDDEFKYLCIYLDIHKVLFVSLEKI
jgi:hypothetical protein